VVEVARGVEDVAVEVEVEVEVEVVGSGGGAEVVGEVSRLLDVWRRPCWRLDVSYKCIRLCIAV